MQLQRRCFQRVFSSLQRLKLGHRPFLSSR
jgi:hypothetical protein